MMTTYHKPVLLIESVDALDIKEDGWYVDATYGGGGHSAEILRRLGPKGKLLVFDQDMDAMEHAPDDKRCIYVRHNYRYLYHFLRYYGMMQVDGVLADLGISSHQIDAAERGFSTRFNATLDMRMSRDSDLQASTILNTYSENDLVRIFSTYGEVFNSKTLAKRIVEARKLQPINEVDEFKAIMSPIADKVHESQYYAKVFQALRIEVNDELGSLKEMLTQCIRIIKPGGRLSVITYHSLEDRILKNFIAKGKFEGDVEKDMFGNAQDVAFGAVNKKPIIASEDEINENPRSRSAKLRVAERKKS
jgi:16S rRNA (cytosine1402-N4)-methyltransferase